MRKVMLIYACAWCNPQSYTKLKKDQIYSHGICEYHQKKLLVEYGRKKQLRLF